ncbi:hypothetical protein [Spiroplasma endosymbiont of Polydrusus pterygomalis]|uniref:hypothetical protein n=1 Tax=Spiroplasma endosymbiont of Polydrusus pterygomalis TaxID=3139327 RepID=UPI003CCB0232
MTDKTESQTYKNIVNNNLENIFEQPNITLKNNKGIFKERHGGLTGKFNNNINVNDEPSKVVINDELNNSDTDGIFIDFNSNTKEVATQTDVIDKKIVNNFIKSYNAVTILEDKKISNIRKKIFDLEKQLKTHKEEYDNLNSNWIEIVNNLTENEYYELNFLSNKLKIMISSKTNKWRSNSELRELYSLKKDIKKVETKINQQEKIKEKIVKTKKIINFNIKKTETKILKLKKKQDENINKLNIPSLSLKDKINKRLDLQQKFEEENLNLKTKEKILEKINFLDNEIEQQWITESKKVTKIYEEILPIDNNYCYITTFVHANQSISEKIIYFNNDENNEITIWQQIKQYENIHEYKNDFSLIEKISSNKKNISFSKMPFKNFIQQQNDFKLKPNKSEKRIWWTIMIISLSLIILPPILTFAVPAILPVAAGLLLIEKIAIAVSGAVLGAIFKGFTSIFSPATKKVESWWYNKLCKNNEKKVKEKKERQSIIKHLTNDKLETKLQAQYDILKQELDNRKDETINELLNNKIINNSSNIEPLNVNNFDSSIRNTVNQQDPQPSTSTIYHSNSML